MRTSALAPMAAAIIAAVEADATLVALIPGGIHQGDAPTGASGAYLTINTPSESASNLFGRAGTENGEQIHIWASSQNAVRVIASRLMLVLGDSAVTVTGFTLIARQVNLVTILRDPDAVKWHGVVRLLARLHET